MKKVILPIIALFFSWSFASYAQQATVENFDNISADTNYVWTGNTEGAPSYLIVKEDSVDKMEGAASLDVNTSIGAFHGWGSYSQLLYRLPANQTMDFSSSDTLKIWIKVVTAPKHPENMLLRFTLMDQDAPGDPFESYVYDNFTAIDSVTGWYLLKIPLHEINSQNGTVVPGDSGFVMVPYTWGGFTYNDHKLNLDKLIGWNIGFITSGWDPNANLPADSLELKLDGFIRTGNRAVPFVIFNGIAVPNNLSAFTWGNASIDVQTGNGPIPNTNSIHWLMGDAWGSGWNGFGYNVSPAFNLSGGWPVDSLSFYMKSDTGVVKMRVQFEDGNAKVGGDINVVQDTLWHRYAIALMDIKIREDSPINPGDFNPANVIVWQIMPEATGNADGGAYGKAGKNVWFSDIWTGHPSAPVPPVAPTGIQAIANNDFTNTVSWNDVPGQSGETYNIYYSTNPITDITASGIEVAGIGVAHGEQIFYHKLIAPATNQSVSYYYAVVCKSGDGLLGTPGMAGSSVANTAKGVVIINPTAPLNFAADGDLSEWTTAGIKPFRVFVSDHSGSVVTNTNVPSDTISSGEIYVAVDQTYLYVAGHINTNNIVFDPSLSSWLNTATDIFLGLYNAHGAPHSSLQTGAQPDYHIRFVQNRAIIDNDGVDSLVALGSNYFWGPRFPDPLAGYNFETKISWQDMAHKSNGGNTRSDNVFVPQVGMRIPFDIELSTCTPGATQRDGQLDYSSIANGNSYANVALWSNSWIGDQWSTGVNDKNQTVSSYQLAQNYPNPFNPSTSIRYSIVQPGKVSLKVYDILGREITTLVNQYQVAGSYTVNFDASKLASGVYFYRIESGAFQNVKKMMLLK
jgi:Secretion system C-terminal sorting domain